MNILLCLSHSVEEENQVRLFTSLGYDVFSIGGYIDPHHPHDPKRPPVLTARQHPELQAAVDAIGAPDNLRAAQEHIPLAVLDWLGDDGVIVFHHYLERLYGDWPRLHRWKMGSPRRRIIWRTVGQSVAHNEALAQPYRDAGLEIVRYSPKEWAIPNFAGSDALIRFYADPAEWSGWTGEWPGVINFTQHLAQRDPYTNFGFWREVTRGLARPLPGMPEDGPDGPFALPLGPGSEAIGGGGEQSYEDMRAWLRRARVYLYCGTQPASYTLGLIEAMMTGTPVVSIGPSFMRVFPYGPDLFEGHEIAGTFAHDGPADQQVRVTRERIDDLLRFDDAARNRSEYVRARAIELFGMETVGRQWAAFLGAP